MANLRRLDRAMQEGGRKSSIYYDELDEEDDGDGEWDANAAHYEDLRGPGLR